MITSIRVGPATNSSSSHSVILHRSTSTVPHDYDAHGDFGWQHFVLSSPEAKLRYMAATGQIDEGVLEDACQLRLGHSMKEVTDSDDYVDHQSVYEIEPPRGIDHQSWVDFVLEPEVVIYGGNDNDGDPPSAMSVGGIEVSARAWRQDGSAIVGYDPVSGVKFRWSPGPYEKAKTPELVDVKITDFCGYGCHFCYQGSTKAGEHADLKDIEHIASQLSIMGVFEVALGGGEPCHHPEFVDILDAFSSRDVSVNFTSFGVDWVEKIPEGYAGGVGISVHSARDVGKIKRSQERIEVRNKGLDYQSFVRPTIIAQTVVGATPWSVIEDTVIECISEDVPILLLGYKTTGRGQDFIPYDASPDQVESLLLLVKNKMKRDEDHWGSSFQLSVDTAFLDRYSHCLDKVGIPANLRSSPEGKFSMYIDAVEMLCGPSSYCDASEMTPVGDILEQFKGY